MAAEDQPVTVRQVFFRLVSRDAIPKTEAAYKDTVCRLLTETRLSGDLPFEWIVDNTRRMRKVLTFSSPDLALRRTAEVYRRSLWDNQDVYVEVWLEKDALSGVLLDVTDLWDVPLMVTRGYSSITFLHEAAQHMKQVGKPVIIYYLGDYDPSGVDIPRVVEAGIRRFAPGIDLTLERVAVNESQIVQMNLDTRPTKPSDSRSKSFRGESVEVDAIRSPVLRDMAASCIERHIDKQALEAVRAAEESERGVLLRMARDLRHDGG